MSHIEPIAPWPTCRGVYFVSSDGHYVKIGKARNIDARLRRLQVGVPQPLKLLAFVRGGDLQDERELHRTFGHLRTRGEWFEPDVELWRFVVDLRSREPVTASHEETRSCIRCGSAFDLKGPDHGAKRCPACRLCACGKQLRRGDLKRCIECHASWKRERETKRRQERVCAKCGGSKTPMAPMCRTCRKQGLRSKCAQCGGLMKKPNRSGKCGQCWTRDELATIGRRSGHLGGGNGGTGRRAPCAPQQGQLFK